MFCSNYRLLGAYQHHLGHVCMFSVSPVIQWTLMSSEHAMKAKTPSTIRETWAQFCRNTYAPAFGFIFDGSPIGKIFWITYILVGMGCVVYVTMDILAGWNGDAFYMTLDASSLEITDLEFPAIAVCDINRISKQRAIQLAENLTEVSSLPFSELLDLTQLIGNMYDRNINQMNKFERLQTILNVYDNGTTEETIIRRLADLMTPCEELLQTCIWNSEPYDCADLFETRLTDTGLCCTFNYPLETAERKIISNRGAKLVDTPRQFMGIGVASGLSLIVNNNLTDYFYTSMATRGVLLKIFSPNNVPDTASGAVKQVVVQEQADVFVDVEVNLLLTEDSLKSNQQKERRCLFADSVSTEFGNYTMSNCLVLCRVQGILDYCRCAPVLVPTNSKSYLSSVSVCNLLDIPCLQEHEARFHTYHFYKNQEMQFQKLIQNEEALLCPACVDNCIEATYGIDTNYFEFFNPDSRYPNSSKIHVFTNRPYTNSYRKIQMVTWYEALSTFGGYVSIFLGFSIMNVIEFALFLIKLGFAVFRRFR
uniref:Sodium channel protein Nach n=1 Tax=Dendroctonus ponderosae TaxID=77166 RepID=A0AAR5P4S3_DENPD